MEVQIGHASQLIILMSILSVFILIKRASKIKHGLDLLAMLRLGIVVIVRIGGAVMLGLIFLIQLTMRIAAVSQSMISIEMIFDSRERSAKL